MLLYHMLIHYNHEATLCAFFVNYKLIFQNQIISKNCSCLYFSLVSLCFYSYVFKFMVHVQSILQGRKVFWGLFVCLKCPLCVLTFSLFFSIIIVYLYTRVGLSFCFAILHPGGLAQVIKNLKWNVHVEDPIALWPSSERSAHATWRHSAWWSVCFL